MTSIELQNLKSRLYADAVLAAKDNTSISTELSMHTIEIIQPCMYTDKALVRDLDTVTAATLLQTLEALGTESSNDPSLSGFSARSTAGSKMELALILVCLRVEI